MHLPLRPTQFLARIANNFRVADDQTNGEFSRQYPMLGSTSKCRRLLLERPKLSMDSLAAFAQKFAPKLDMAAAEFVRCLYNHDPSEDPRIGEYLLPTAFSGTRRMLKTATDFLLKRMRQADEIVQLGHFLPAWTVARHFQLRAISCATKVVDSRKIAADLLLAGKLHLTFVEGVERQRILLPLLRSEYEAITGREPPFDRFSEEEISEVCDDLTRSEQFSSIIVDDRTPSFPADYRRYWARYSMVVLLDDTMLAKQLRNRRAWLFFDREQGPEVGRFIDHERHFLAGLRRFKINAPNADAIDNIVDSVSQ
jgi:hypothetical protein